MKVGLIDVDSRIPNLALMKISAWHRLMGHEVEWYHPLWEKEYDIVYASKIFKFTPDKYMPPDCIKGGTGYDIHSVLPPVIEKMFPDYSLYACDYAIGFITRGCHRRCEFCIVPEKEGHIRRVADVSSFWNGQDKIMLLDNNLTAHPDCIEILRELKATKAKINFSQGLDLRLITPESAVELSTMKLWKQLHFAWDDIKHEKQIFRGLNCLIRNGVSKRKIMVYVLIGFNSTHEEDIYRIEKLREYGVDSFVMAYNKHDLYQRRFARWVNHKAIHKSVTWKEYSSRYPIIKSALPKARESAYERPIGTFSYPSMGSGSAGRH